MKILIINSVCGVGSTGKICTEIAQRYELDGHEVKIAYGRKAVPESFAKYAVKIGNNIDVYFSALHTRLTDRHGFANRIATRRFLKFADEFNPDVIWLHNLHGYYINLEMLFAWIKKRKNIEVKWTLHDCWAFTGHCSHFTFVNCNKWKNGCNGCPQNRIYPSSICDRSELNYRTKRELFDGVPNLTLITPSKWLSSLVSQSFLKDYRVIVENNNIDSNVFKPTYGVFKDNYNLQDKKIILAVASQWNERKGIYDILKLSDMIDEDYRIVIVGISSSQQKKLPANVVGILRTENQTQLSEIYTAADVFVNPTYEDNYPTVNLEAQSCGTPVISYDTGGCAETLYTPFSQTVPCGNIEMLWSRVRELIER